MTLLIQTKMFRKLYQYQFVWLLFFLGVTTSCKKDLEINRGQTSQFLPSFSGQEDSGETSMVLGNQLPNPYEVGNMTQAFSNISANFPGISSPVFTSHKYIKFIIDNQTEMSVLNQQTEILTYPYPLDYEIIGDGTYFNFDDGQCDTCEAAQFACVESSQTLPEIDIELLADLYLPEEDDNLRDLFESEEDYEIFEDALLEEAFTLVGLDIEILPGMKVARRPKWTPAGRIRFRDAHINALIPVVGVEVRARRWFTTHKGITSSTGHYTCDGEFRRDANYSLKWDRKDFSIRSGSYGQAWYNGPKRTGDWNVDIGTNPQLYYAIIFRAAYQYYYEYIDGLARPPLNDFWTPQLRIAAHNSNNDSANGQFLAIRRFLGLGNAIKIWNPSSTIVNLHSTTIHELAHAAHWNLTSIPKGAFNYGDNFVVESWARGVQWWLTKKIYSNYQPSYRFIDYTGVVQDMIDDDTSNPADKVAGYSITQIEQSVVDARSGSEWKDNLKNNHTNATETELDALFDYWD